MKVFHLYRYKKIYTGTPIYSKNTGIRIDTCALSHYSSFTMCTAIVMQSIYLGYYESKTFPFLNQRVHLVS